MIRHMIFVALDGDRPDAIDEATASFATQTEIDGVEQAVVHHDTSGRSRGYDRLLLLDFRDADALAAWNEHQAHHDLVAAIKGSGASVLFFDHEL